MTTTLPRLTVSHDVYLLRHGETEWNKDQRVQGQMNSDLTELGRGQACQQAKILARIRPALSDHTLWASPLSRAQETAKLAFDGAVFSTDARLSEINCGAWEGTTHEERQARDPEIVARLQSEYDMYTSGPGGESTEDIVSRLFSFLSDLEGPAIIVSHKVAIVVMRALLADDPEGLDCRLVPAQGSVLRISNGVDTTYDLARRTETSLISSFWDYIPRAGKRT